MQSPIAYAPMPMYAAAPYTTVIPGYAAAPMPTVTPYGAAPMLVQMPMAAGTHFYMPATAPSTGAAAVAAAPPAPAPAVPAAEATVAATIAAAAAGPVYNPDDTELWSPEATGSPPPPSTSTPPPASAWEDELDEDKPSVALSLLNGVLMLGGLAAILYLLMMLHVIPRLF